MSLDLPTDSKIIGGVAYEVSMLPLRDWLVLKEVVLRTIGSAVAEMLADMNQDLQAILDLDITTATVGRGIYTLSAKSTPEADQAMLDLLAKCTRVNGEALNAAGHWPRHMENLVPFLVFALGVQFSDFFGGLAKSIPGAQVKGESKSPSQLQAGG